MKEHLNLDITERFGKLVEKVRGEKPKEPKDASDVKEQKKIVIEWALRSATNRVILARNVGELSNQLDEVAGDLSAGKDPEKIDGLRVAVMLKVEEVVDNQELASAQTRVGTLLKNGDVAGAVTWLRKISKQNEYKVVANKQKDVDDLLDTVVELDQEKSTDPKVIKSKAESVIDKGEELKKVVENETKKMTNTSEKIEAEIQRKFVERETKKTGPKRTPEGKVEVKEADVKKIAKQAETAITGDDDAVEKDKKFIKRVLSGGRTGFGSLDKDGNLTMEIDKYEHIGAQYLYARASVALGRNKAELSKPENLELKEYLENLQFELRERLMEIEGENKEKKVAKNLMPGEVEWRDLPPELRAQIDDNGEFIKKYRNAEDVHKLAELNGRMNKSRSEQAINELLKEREDLRTKLVKNGEDYHWDGDAEDFFELCRQEIFKIKDVIPEERLGNLVFEDKAQLYLALMGVSSKDNPKIRQAKDAVTKTLYMEFALKSLWKAGGNHEAWQKAGGLLLREEAGTNFFLTMKMREKIRGKAKVGDKLIGVELPGFNVDDIMTMGELAAPNGQSWLAYISTDNMTLNEARLKEYVKAMAQETIRKAELVAKMPGGKQLSDLERLSIELFRKSETNIEFDAEQMDYIRNYTHYMHTVTLNAGEKLWLMDAMKPGDKGFDYASIPGGQFAEKSGLFGVLYFAKYQVTKYGYEALGKLFVPNHGLLSYARGETLRHFLTDEGNAAWIPDTMGDPNNIGKGGARDFFFAGKDIDDSKIKSFNKFWEEIWFDRRTGSGLKTKGMRAIKHSRDVGRKLMSTGKHTEAGKDFSVNYKDFVNEMDFVKMEAKIGYKIPGESNEAKLSWMVDNLSYEMMEVGTMPSKREGDWLIKYTKYMTETDMALQAFLDAPTLANKMKIIESVFKYNSGAAEDMSKMLSDFMESNRKKSWGPTVLKRDKDGKMVDPIKDSDGGNMIVPTEVISPFEGWYPGRGMFFTRQAYKEGTNDPMIMRKLEIQNAIAWGIVDAKEGGRMMRDWQKMIYFGDQITIGKLKFRPGMIPFITPYLLMRGWWVDKMGMDWEDFKLITSKQNEETWEKLKKLLGIEI